MQEFEVIKTKAKKVCCSGTDSNEFHHPKIYLKLDAETGSVVCPYCSKKFSN